VRISFIFFLNGGAEGLQLVQPRLPGPIFCGFEALLETGTERAKECLLGLRADIHPSFWNRRGTDIAAPTARMPPWAITTEGLELVLIRQFHVLCYCRLLSPQIGCTAVGGWPCSKV
jgi:hypothetical protein